MPDEQRRNGSAGGYYRQPTVHDDRVVFVSEDDLWEVPLMGGRAVRLTTGRGQASQPRLSPGGDRLAFVSTEEGAPEVFVMDAAGGPARQLTYEAGQALVAGWSADGAQIVFASNIHQPFGNNFSLFGVDPDGGQPQALPYGEGLSISFEPGGKGVVLARFSDDLARWKRYQGGTAGVLWIQEGGQGSWRRLMPEIRSGKCRPMWIDSRVWFISDFEGYGNLYSCLPSGDDIRRHSDHTGFYARHASSDGRWIVYSRGGEIWRLDASDPDARPEPVEVRYGSPRTALQRRFVDAEDYLEDAALHPRGHSVAAVARGKAFNMGLWEGAARQTGAEHGVRHRLPRYLGDGQRIVVASDAGGEEGLEIHRFDGTEVRRLKIDPAALGRPLQMEVAPTAPDRLAITNHRHELLLVDLEREDVRSIDRSDYQRLNGLSWSPDGRWIAYGLADSHSTSVIKVADARSGEVFEATHSEFFDHEPCFDPQGRYLYFLSTRHFDPVYDLIFFDLGFYEGARLCALLLQEDTPNPFVQRPRPLEDGDDGDGDDDEDGDTSSGDGEGEDEESEDDTGPVAASSSSASSDEGDGAGGGAGEEDEAGEKEADRKAAPPEVKIDREGLAGRVVVFPVPGGDYRDIVATDKRVFYTSFRRRGALSGGGSDDDEDEGGAQLRYWDLKKHRSRGFADGVEAVRLGPDGKTLLLANEHGLQVVSASGSGPDDDDGDGQPSRSTGILDLSRFSVEVEQRAEWRQMLREAWRLMREHYWRADMAGVDWEEVWHRYSGLLSRVTTRGEFSDLVWTMQGEMGTSHAYEFGGDYYEAPPQYAPGYLAAHFRWSAEAQGYIIEEIVTGDRWSGRESSPLARPGVDIREGDVLLAIDGRPLSEHVSVQQRLVSLAGREVELLIRRPGAEGDQDRPRRVTVRTLRSELRVRYRDWVRRNRERVREAFDGKVGYLHVPDMGPRGYAEFHRSWLAENGRRGLIVDVRHNGGGHVSQLILEKLARTPLGFDVQRWGKPMSYPGESVWGPLVALTNEKAGSDGDIFSHCFKLQRMGPLVGKRTWGGVIGIWPRHTLVDGSVTTQPEFSFWFEDVGFGVENYGTDPDIDVDFPPGAGQGADDPQLERAIDEMRQRLEDRPSPVPRSFAPYPNLAPPGKLPPRPQDRGEER